MNNRQKSEHIIKAVDKVYSIPTYLWDRVETAIINELANIEYEEGKKKNET